jgi:hypothetical protein
VVRCPTEAVGCSRGLVGCSCTAVKAELQQDLTRTLRSYKASFRRALKARQAQSLAARSVYLEDECKEGSLGQCSSDAELECA